MTPNPFLKNRPAVYGIRNIVNGKVYVGRTACMHRRCGQYLYDFRERRIRHLNDHLYNAISKYGLENFEMFPLEFCTSENIAERELYWMDLLKSCDRKHGYNLRRDADGAMVTHAETSERIRQNLKQQWASGVRDGHGEKLKRKWAERPDRREWQGQFFSETLTKWLYDIALPEGTRTVRYVELKSMGYGSAMSSFSRTKLDTITLKGVVITRRRVGS